MGIAKFPSIVHSEGEVHDHYCNWHRSGQERFCGTRHRFFGQGRFNKPSVRRDALVELIAKLPPCLVGMEACSGAHHWARRIRGLLSEFGIVLPQKAEVVRRKAGLHLEDLPGWANTAIGDSLSELHHLDERIAEYDLHIKAMAKADDRGRKLMAMPGVARRRPAHCWPASAMDMTSNAAGNWRLGWAGAWAVQLRRQTATRAHHQSWRQLSQNIADPGRQGGAGQQQKQDRQAQSLGAERGRAARLLESGGGRGGQERAHGLGHAQQRRSVQTAGLSTGWC
jgi:hypothetical protein